jgi:hypothetical protein
VKAESRNEKAKTQKLRKGIMQLGNQEIRKGIAAGSRWAVFFSGFLDFLIHHLPAQARELKKSFSEFLSFGLAPFGFQV